MCAWFSKKKKKAEKSAVKTTAAAASATAAPKQQQKTEANPEKGTSPEGDPPKAAPEPAEPERLLSPEAEAALIKLAAALTDDEEKGDAGERPDKAPTEAEAMATVATQSAMACSSYSTCRSRLRQAARKACPRSDLMKRATTLGDRPSWSAMVVKPASFARSGQSERVRSSGSSTMPRVVKYGGPFQSQSVTHEGSAARPMPPAATLRKCLRDGPLRAFMPT